MLVPFYLSLAFPAFASVYSSTDICRRLDIAYKNGPAEIDELFQDPSFDPGAHDQCAIKWAVLGGRKGIVERLLDDPRVDPSAGGQCAIIFAAHQGDSEIVEVLLKDNRVDPNACDPHKVSGSECEQIYKLLFKCPRIDPSAHGQYAIKWAAEHGHKDIVEWLLLDPRVDPSVEEQHPIRLAAQHGHVEVMERLLKDDRVDPNACDIQRVASDEARILLLKDARVDPGARDQYALKWAVMGGHEGTVKLLLSDDRVDPSTANQCVIKVAAHNGYKEIVELLLKDDRVDPNACDPQRITGSKQQEIYQLLYSSPRIDPSAHSQHAIKWAAQHGDAEIVERLLKDDRADPNACDLSRVYNDKVFLLLLKDPRLDPSGYDQRAIIWAAEFGQTEAVELLLKDARVDPGAENQYAIKKTAENGHAEIVRLLLKHDRVDPGAENQYAIRNAAKNGHAEIVKLLLSDARVDPGAEDQEAIQSAAARGHEEVVRLLLLDSRVDPSANNQYAIRFGATHLGVSEVLLHHPDMVIPEYLRMCVPIPILDVLPLALLKACAEGDLGSVNEFEETLKKLSPQHLDLLMSRARKHAEAVGCLRAFQRAVMYEYLRRVQYAHLHIPLHTLLEPQNESRLSILKLTYRILEEGTDEHNNFESVLNRVLEHEISTVQLAEHIKAILRTGLDFLIELQVLMATLGEK